MAATVEGFLLAYPEFIPLNADDPAFVAAVLVRAERRIGNAWPAEVRDDIVELQCAHMLALSPSGRNAKLSEPGKPTAYECELKERKKGNAFGQLRVV